MSHSTSPTAPLSPPQSPPQRSAALDAVRGVAVIAMVMGHTLDATLSDEARLAPGVQVYWALRSVTAPLFLAVAGWAMTAAMARSGRRGVEVVRRYLPRVGLLLACGVALRWPGWDLRGLFTLQRPVWQHLFAFDALHCVGASVLLAALLFAWIPQRSARVALSLAILLLFPSVSPLLGAWAPQHFAALPLAQALASPLSPFPIFPWAAYFFSGVLLGHALEVAHRVHPALVSLSLGFGVVGLLVSPAGGLLPMDVAQFYWRLALMLPVAAAALVMPQMWAARLAPVGRASLWAYVLHLPIAYGWSTFPGLAARVGKTLSLGPALLLALGVLAVSLAAALWAKRSFSPFQARLLARFFGRTGRARAASVLPRPLVPPDADART